MCKILSVALAAFAVPVLTIGEAGAAARKGSYFVGGYGPHHRGGHKVGGPVAQHPVRALLRRL